MRPPRAMGWVGGKSGHGAHKTGQWIAGLLPPVGETYTYVEPFAGMLGVLLQRTPARREIVSDLDKDLINWWRAVRDYPQELGDRLDWTPGWSAHLFSEAVDVINQQWDVSAFGPEECVVHAWYFTLALCWVRGNMIGRVRDAANPDTAARRKVVGKHQRDTAQFSEREAWSARRADVNMKRLAWPPADAELRKNPGQPRGYPHRKPVRRTSGEMSPPRSEHILRLRERVAELELETRSAEWMCSYYAENPNITWYLDPPYQIAAEKGLYSHNLLDITDWIPRLQELRGLVAISGYGEEWDGLGWQRHEHRTYAHAGAQHEGDRPERTEVLWTNYDASEFEREPGLF